MITTIMNEENLFVRNIVSNTVKTMEMKAAIYSGSLYIVIFNGVVLKIDLSGKIRPDIYCGFTNEDLKNNLDYIINNQVVLNEVLRQSQIISSGFISSGLNLIYSNPSLREDEVFESIIQSKSSDGAYKYFVSTDNGYNVFMTLFKGMFNLNKPDRIGLNIYNTTDSNISLANFNIYKKKININYDMFFLFMNFNTERRFI